MQTYTDHPLANRLRKNLRSLKSFLKQEGVTCYRLFDWDMPEYPLCIDRYEDHIQVAEYQTRHGLQEEDYQQWLNECLHVIELVCEVPSEHVHIKRRERMKGSAQYEKVNQSGQRKVVLESGLKFYVNLDDYLDTGLFLDHRPLRSKVKQQSQGKHVLNLFAYTGSFSVYATAGGAFTTTTVDLSNTYLNWARDNFTLNGFSKAKHSFIKADAKEWLKQNPTRLYDIIVLDPPTHSKSSMAKTPFDIQLDHVELLRNTGRHLHPEGVLYFSTNFRNFILDAAALPELTLTDITIKTIPQDFRNKKIHYCWEIRKASNV
jgi:23S rRNA (cytosine1962-C5)-methyltransferase